MIPSVCAVALLAALPALAQSRPSIGAIKVEQQRLEAAICAKADADGDAYRPFVCEPRCDCFQTAGVATSCQETSPGTYQIEFETLPGTCTGQGVCSNSSLQSCAPTVPNCPSGETCSGNIVYFCSRACSTDADCPPVPSGTGLLTGVTTPDSPDVVSCAFGVGVQTSINSNDALECLAEVEAVVSCQ